MGGRPARLAGNLTAICEPIVWKIREPRHLTTLWASTACYRDSFTSYLTCFNWRSIILAFYGSLGCVRRLIVYSGCVVCEVYVQYDVIVRDFRARWRIFLYSRYVLRDECSQ
jgi:hypothetical protein